MKKIHLEYSQSSKIKKKILILGKNSTLSKELYNLIKKDNFDIERTSKKEINFKSDNFKIKLKKKLSSFNPDIIINFIGKFDLNEKATKDLLILNILPTWEILKIFFYKKIKKKLIW